MGKKRSAKKGKDQPMSPLTAVVGPPTPEKVTSESEGKGLQPDKANGTILSVVSPFQTPPLSPPPIGAAADKPLPVPEPPLTDAVVSIPTATPHVDDAPTPVSDTAADVHPGSSLLLATQHQLSSMSEEKQHSAVPGDISTPVQRPITPGRSSPGKVHETLNISPEGMSKDIIAIAEVFASMKKTLGSLSQAFDRLGTQTEKMHALSLDIKAVEQLKQVRDRMERQMEEQKREIESLRSALESKIKDSVREQVTLHVHTMVKDMIAKAVKEKVQEQLDVQMPEDLREQVISHRRQLLEVKTDLHNSEARRHNATLQSASLTAPLRPLLRPLPTPEQSPMPISRSSSVNSTASASPTALFPNAPAPTPIKRSNSRGLTVPPTPSLLFPRDLKSLFSLKPGDAKTLLKEYGLTSATSTPVVDKPRRRLPEVCEESGTESPLNVQIEQPSEEESDEENSESHIGRMNTFMAHIGVPFLMIPPRVAPEPATQEGPEPMSATTRRRMLPPLIINTGPRSY